MLRFFCARTIYFVAGFVVASHNFGQVMQLFCLNIIGEHGTISTSPIIVINKGRHERFTQR